MFKKIIEKIHNRLIRQAKTIAVAESCTGGQLSSFLSSLPGSSNYFLLGVVTYSNKSKEMILDIPSKTISSYGAVSQPIAILMAKNIRKITHADFGLSITGIAGPAGATAAKPVGTVFIALATKNKTLCRLFLLPGQREDIRKKSVGEALRLLYTQI
jgi:nicotinamide-nucleotide amidase